MFRVEMSEEELRVVFLRAPTVDTESARRKEILSLIARLGDRLKVDFSSMRRGFKGEMDTRRATAARSGAYARSKRLRLSSLPGLNALAATSAAVCKLPRLVAWTRLVEYRRRRLLDVRAKRRARLAELVGPVIILSRY